MIRTHQEQLSRRRILTTASPTLGGGLLARHPLRAAALFGATTTVTAGVLNVAYAEAGPSNGPAVVLLHGWPYDIYSYADELHAWHRPVIAS